MRVKITPELCIRFESALQSVIPNGYRLYDLYNAGLYGIILKFCDEKEDNCIAVKLQRDVGKPNVRDAILTEYKIQDAMSNENLAVKLHHTMELVKIPYPHSVETMDAFAFSMDVIKMNLLQFFECSEQKHMKQVIQSTMLMMYRKAKQDLIHGDMHLGNIALVPYQDTYRIVLIDFGFSRFTNDPLEQFVDMIPLIGHLANANILFAAKFFMLVSNAVYGTSFQSIHYFMKSSGFEYSDSSGFIISSYKPIDQGGLRDRNLEHVPLKTLKQSWTRLKPLDVEILLDIVRMTQREDDPTKFLDALSQYSVENKPTIF